jgi:hypothetical protein
MGQRVHSQQPEEALLRERKVAGKRDSEVSIGEREIADGLEEPAVVPMRKAGWRLNSTTDRTPQALERASIRSIVLSAPIVKVQQIKDLLPELGEGAGIHTLHNASFLGSLQAHSLNSTS